MKQMQQFDENQKQVSANYPSLFMMASGLILGATVEYFMDPARGRRRRAILKDWLFSRGHYLSEDAHRMFDDLKNRAIGTIAELHVLRRNEAVSDEILNQRVRSSFGREVRHAKSIHTIVVNGIVTLSGPILADEVGKLLKCVEAVPGVRDVINQLDIYRDPKGVPGLQGAGPEYLQ